MEKIQFLEVTPQQLQNEITNGVKAHLDEFLKTFKPKHPNDYLTRQQTADLLSVDLSTLFNWNKSGKLNPLGLGNRVYYLRSEIEASMTPLNS
jgi:hypothetical protein